jgi:hypothetical protein
MMKRLALLTLAMVGVAGVAHAQQSVTVYRSGPPPAPVYVPAPYPSQAMTMDSGRSSSPAITDEYGMRYNSYGDRIDAQGRIMPPPVTPPGVRAYR